MKKRRARTAMSAARGHVLCSCLSRLTASLLLFSSPAWSASPRAVSRIRSRTPLSFATTRISSEEWYQLTMLGRPVGYAHNSFQKAMRGGKPCWRVEEVVHLQFKPNLGFHDSTVHYVRNDGTHLESIDTRQAPTDRTVTHAVYHPGFVNCSVARGDAPLRIVRVPVPPRVQIAPETPYDVAPALLTAGRIVHQWVLDLDQLAVREQLLEIGKPEELQVPGRGGVRTWPVQVHYRGESEGYRVWLNSDGETMRVNLPFQGVDVIGYLRPPGEKGVQTTYQPVWTVGARGILAATPPIRRPREATVLDLTIENAPRELALPTDDHQSATWTGPHTLHLSVAMPGAPLLPTTAPSSILELNRNGVLPPQESSRLLASNNWINWKDEELPAITARVIRGVQDPVARCLAIRDWIFLQMKEDAGMPTLRGALSILHTPRGVCRDYATLYAAMARAAGVPTRVCVGIAYFDGGFWGHAWNESWVGDWLPIDSTLEGHFADATHIKLAEGDVEDAMDRGVTPLLKLADPAVRIHVDWVQPESSELETAERAVRPQWIARRLAQDDFPSPAPRPRIHSSGEAAPGTPH